MISFTDFLVNRVAFRKFRWYPSPATGDVACFSIQRNSTVEGAMGSRRASRSASTALFQFLLISAVVLTTSASWAASKTTQIYSFTGNAGGEYTDTELARD